MPETPPERATDEQAFNELVILRILYRRALLIGVLTVLVGVVVAGWSLTRPNVYESAAGLIVQAPEAPLPGERPPLSIEALRALVGSTAIKRQTFDWLMAQGELPDDKTFLSFQNSLEVRTEREESRDRALLPVLHLAAKSTEPERASRIANTWTSFTLSQTQAIYRTGVEDYGGFVQDKFNDVSESLAESEDRYTSKLLASDLEVTRSQLRNAQKTYDRVNGELLALRGQIRRDEAALEALEDYVADREVDGIWMGEYYMEAGGEDSTRTQVAMAVGGDAGTTAAQIRRVIERIARNEERLGRFERQSNLSYLKMQMAVYEKDLTEISAMLLDAAGKIAESRERRDELEKQLEDVPEKIVLNKAITDDALWGQYLEADGRAQAIEGTPPLKTEEYNPVYEEIRKNLANMAAEIAAQEQRAASMQQRERDLREAVAQLSEKVSVQENKRVNLERMLDKDQALLDTLENEYNEARQQIPRLTRKIRAARAEAQAREDLLGGLDDRIASLTKGLEHSELALDRQDRVTSDLLKVRNDLAAKARRVELLRVTTFEAARSGVARLYPAQPNPQKVAPSRTRMVLVAMLVAFLALSAFFVLREFVRTD